jgi:hypothetical protein
MVLVPKYYALVERELQFGRNMNHTSIPIVYFNLTWLFVSPQHHQN